MVSAFLIATAPFVVGYSTRVLPDMALGVIAGFSILFFVCAQENRRGKYLYFLSGVFAALTVYIKFIGLAYVLLFLVCLTFYRLTGKRRTKSDANHGLVYPLLGLLLFALLYAAVFISSVAILSRPQ